jgi:hypothetical protein
MIFHSMHVHLWSLLGSCASTNSQLMRWSTKVSQYVALKVNLEAWRD